MSVASLQLGEEEPNILGMRGTLHTLLLMYE